MKEENKNWICGKCNGANVPEHFRTCSKRETQDPEALIQEIMNEVFIGEIENVNK
jgi:hypothetical protein